MITKNIELFNQERNNPALDNIIKNICISNINFLIVKDLTKDIEKILNNYINKSIGEKRAEEITRKIGKLIYKKTGLEFYHYEKSGKYNGEFKDINNQKLEWNDEKKKNMFYIRTNTRSSSYYGTYIDITIEYNEKKLKTFAFELLEKEKKYIYDSRWDKLKYTELNDIELVANNLIETYNNTVLKIRELKNEIEKQTKIINNDYIRTISNNSLYIYNDYRDKIIEI